jgi:site-specific DNA-cytosine methylase
VTARAPGPLILSLCDYSGTWSQPYRDAGYEVMQIDLKLGGDVCLFKKLDRPVHGILAAPVCTAFSAAGAKHWKAKAAEGNTQLKEGMAIVDACLRIVFVHRPKWWVMENPVGRLKDWIGYHRFTFNPNEFAGYLGDDWEDDAYTKRTCLWGEFNIPKPNERPPIHGSKMWAKYGGKSERTKELRSITPRGFARAFFEANP